MIKIKLYQHQDTYLGNQIISEFLTFICSINNIQVQKVGQMMSKQILTKTLSNRISASKITKTPFKLASKCTLNIQSNYPQFITPNLKYQFATSGTKSQTSSNNSDKNHYFDAESSYFEILGIQPNATEQQIKASYLEMVKKYHPDLSKQENASQKFQLIQKAYEVLSDPEQRGRHKQELKIPNPETYDQADEFKDKYKNFKRKDSVPDEWHLTYRLFKKHYEEVDAKEKEYKRFQGQGDSYYVHKNEMQTSKKVYAQQFGMIGGTFGIIAGIYYYMNN